MLKKILVLSVILSSFALFGTAKADCGGFEEDPCGVVGLEFLGPNQNLNPVNFIPQLVGEWTGVDIVSRDQANNFFLNGRHIELPEFKKLKINADWVLPGVRVNLLDVVTN